MSQCQNCSAPLSFRSDAPVVCEYCGASNLPPPKEVEVPVPVQLVQNVIQVAGGERPHELRCPHCKKRLFGVRVEDVELDGCGGCGGIWIENTSAQRVVASPRAVFEELALRAAKNAHGRKVRARRPACPVCDATLDPVTVKKIPLDVCVDHGTWFDARELALLSARLRGVPARELSAGIGGEVPCAVCGKSIDAALANIGEEGPTCEMCWRARQAELVRLADAGHEQHVGMVGGAGAGVLLVGLAAALVAAGGASDS
jgi:Zn-finger nucleic acid-binding protein